MRRWLVVPAFVVAVAFALLAVAVINLVLLDRAFGHSWYPTECCAGDDVDGDCHEIPAEAVTEGSDVFIVRLDGRVFVVPRERARFSPDGRYHACHQPNAGELMCFFYPPKDM